MALAAFRSVTRLFARGAEAGRTRIATAFLVTVSSALCTMPRGPRPISCLRTKRGGLAVGAAVAGSAGRVTGVAALATGAVAGVATGAADAAATGTGGATRFGAEGSGAPLSSAVTRAPTSLNSKSSDRIRL